MKPNETTEAAMEFLAAFEEVFDRDWAHTKELLCILDETEAQKAAALAVGLETIHVIDPSGTFIHPKVDDEAQDWGNRERLLNAYRALKRIINQN